MATQSLCALLMCIFVTRNNGQLIGDQPVGSMCNYFHFPSTKLAVLRCLQSWMGKLRLNRRVKKFLPFAQIHMREGLSLIEGSAEEGFLQLNYDGRSGLLCVDGVGREEAVVACKDLGLPFQYPSIRPKAPPEGTGFLGYHLRCQGNEIKLSDCSHDPWGSGGSCPGNEAAFLSCPVDPCNPSPCENGGSCETMSSGLFGYRCNCTSAWSGPICSSDVNECYDNNGGCGELCVNMDGSYSCECPQQQLELAADNHTCSAPGEQVVCKSDVMELTLEKALFPSLHREHLTLSDVSCGATDNATHIILRAPLAACGTISQQVGEAIVYKNVVHSREEVVDGVISRVKDVEIPFQCVMTLQEVRETFVNVDTSELHFLLEGTGRHDVKLDFSVNGGSNQGHGQVSVFPGQQIQGLVTLTTADPHLNVALRNCTASTTLFHNSTGTPYTLLNNGCAQDSTLVIANVTDSTHQNFHLEAFKFLDNSPQVAFHCDVTLCDDADAGSVCAQGCVARQ